MKQTKILSLILFFLIAPSFNMKSQESVLYMDPQINMSDSTEYNEAEILFMNMGEPDFSPTVINKIFAPRVFFGYRNLSRPKYEFNPISLLGNYKVSEGSDSISGNLLNEFNKFMSGQNYVPDSLIFSAFRNAEYHPYANTVNDLGIDILNSDRIPNWLANSNRFYKFQDDFIYGLMIENPELIEYAYWDLPEPPQLIPSEVSFRTYVKKLNLPTIDMDKAIIPEENIKKIHWLHTFGTLLQFSQAYVSPNWYQGGNNYLALLFNFNWNVQLNQVYHPNLLFQSNFQYKLALSSNPKNQLHKYTISEDALQYNLNAGVKAWKNWFYSFNMLFKTQLLNNYEEDSWTRTASFLSPGDLNMGIGMAYSYKNKYNTFQFTATISPLSYNLKTCISDKVDHSQFNISPNRKVKNEIGSNAEFNMTWEIHPNITYKTRVFLFSDYKYFLSDWENTFSFAINKFLSTQVYVHLRYDSSSEKNTSWKTFMMREILSFGLSYTFSTKP